MGDKGEPQISACKGSDNWTCVTFRPDLAKFGMVALTDAMVALMRKRVYDMAGVLGKTVKARHACLASGVLHACMHAKNLPKRMVEHAVPRGAACSSGAMNLVTPVSGLLRQHASLLGAAQH